MKSKLKIIICIVCAVFAALSLAAVLGTLGVLPAAAATDTQTYALREYEGYVGVFYPAEATTPTTVTGIRVKDLPVSDRLELAVGIGVPAYRDVLLLLEDFGS